MDKCGIPRQERSVPSALWRIAANNISYPGPDTYDRPQNRRCQVLRTASRSITSDHGPDPTVKLNLIHGDSFMYSTKPEI